MFGPQWKDRESCYQVRQILALFCKLATLILNSNCVKDIRVTKIAKEIKFEGVCDQLEARNSFQTQSGKPFSLFVSLLTALIVKNSYILPGIYFIFLKQRPRSNLKGIQ